jgi:phosphoribosylanthranilate isomerase
MMRVKICGITNLEDAQAAVASGADALGFVFYSPSPRRIDPDLARKIIAQLPPFVVTVGVFVDAPTDLVQSIREGCGLTLIQFHGGESPEQVARFGASAIKAVRIRGEEDFRGLSRYAVCTYLLDAHVEGVPGGTGKTFNWDLARRAKSYGRIILAGGLTQENVHSAIRAAEPDAVDVSSGVEERPGKKDPEKMTRFIAEAKRAIS